MGTLSFIQRPLNKGRTAMARDMFEDATSLHSRPAPETELSAPVEFDVRVRVPLIYTMKVKATSTAKAYDLARALSWPRDFVPGTPHSHEGVIAGVERFGGDVDPVVTTISLDGTLRWER
jgi:hypothetical protein